MLQLSDGRSLDDFKQAWEEAVAAGMNEDSDSDADA